MTTICWDGKELVADTRVTHYNADDSAVERVSHGEIRKIIAPTTLTMEGAPVRAMAAAGDLRFLKAAMKLNEHDTNPDTGLPLIKEMTDDVFYGQFMAFIKIDAAAIVLTDEYSYLVTIRMMGEDKRWEVLKYPRTHMSMIGTGVTAIQLAMQDPKKLGDITLEDLFASSARKIVQLGIVADPHSGGNLDIWTQENGHNVTELDAPIQAAKNFADEQPDGMLPDGDGHDEELDRRLEAVVAQRAARQAA